MYFHTDSGSARDFVGNVARLAAEHEQSLRIDVDDAGNLRMKRGEGVWSAPIYSTPDPYRDGSVKGMKWFVNEDGTAYEYPAEYQRETYPNDFHTPFDSEDEAEHWADTNLADPDTDDGVECEECLGSDGAHYLNCSVWSFN